MKKFDVCYDVITTITIREMRDNSMLQDHIVKKLNELENKSYTIAGNITKINLFLTNF
jgi:hypothetical protein